MKMARFGGANHVRQNNGRAPEGRGIWCFPLGLVDLVYLRGTDKFVGRKTKGGKRIKVAPTRTFVHKGEIWVGVEDVPERLLHKALAFRDREGKSWALLDHQTFKKVVNIKKMQHHKNVASLVGPGKTGKRSVEIQRTRELTKDRILVYFVVSTECSIHGNETSPLRNAEVPAPVFERGEAAVRSFLVQEELGGAWGGLCPHCALKINAGMECFIPGTKQ